MEYIYNLYSKLNYFSLIKTLHMATPVVAGGDLLSVDELERELAALISHVQREKERVSSNFQQLHVLLAAREHTLLQEMDEVVVRARQELADKREVLKELETARESTERDLTKNILRDVLDKNLRTLEDKIGEELSRGVSVGWLELDWKKEQLEQSLIEACKVVTLKERPFRSEDYSLKLRPVWSREGTGPGEIMHPFQIAIDNSTQNIFVSDGDANRIQVFNEEGNHLYKIPTPEYPRGIALTEEYIFVSAQNQLLKIRKSNNKSVKSVQTEKSVCGIDIDRNRNIYGCENGNKSVIVFDNNLKFLKRIKLETSQIKSDTQTHSIKLYKDSMYVMFGRYPPFHLQIFSLEGALVRCLIPTIEIGWSYFFSIDRFGNIIVADWWDSRINIFNKEGELLHTINSDMLPGDLKFCCPQGVAVNKKNRIIIALRNSECCLLAF